MNEEKKRKIIASILFVLATILFASWALIVWYFYNNFSSLVVWILWLCDSYCNGCDCDLGFAGSLVSSIMISALIITYFAGLWLGIKGYTYYKKGCFHCPDEEVYRDRWFPV